MCMSSVTYIPYRCYCLVILHAAALSEIDDCINGSTL